MRAIMGLVVLVASAAQAQERQTMAIPQGLQAVVTLKSPFDSATVGDPDIIDAMPRSDRTLVVSGRKAGTSDILFFQEGRALYQITVNVSGPSTPGKVLNHNQKSLGDYVAYSCTPVCARTDDKFEARPVLIVGPGGAISNATATGNTINVLTPPGR